MEFTSVVFLTLIHALGIQDEITWETKAGVMTTLTVSSVLNSAQFTQTVRVTCLQIIGLSEMYQVL